MKTINPNLPKIKLTFKGREIEIPYNYSKWPGLTYIDIMDNKGKEYRFYKGLYRPDEWTAKGTEDWGHEFISLLVAAFENLEPKYSELNRGKFCHEEIRWWETP